MNFSIKGITIWKLVILSGISSLLFVPILLFNAGAFSRFIGPSSPILVYLLSILFGLLSYVWLAKYWSLMIWDDDLGNNLRFHHLFVIYFAIVPICTDWAHHFPKEINIQFPASILFYLFIAFLVEIIFHLIPLGITSYILHRMNILRERLWWYCAGIVALLEPIFQSFFMQEEPLWVLLVTFVNLLAFNWLQLLLLKKSGFLSMLLCRLFYYLIWHIIWGAVRLEILF